MLLISGHHVAASTLLSIVAVIACRAGDGTADATDSEHTTSAAMTESDADTTAEGETSGVVDACGVAPAEMVCVPGGPFTMGAAGTEADEEPERAVTLSPFWIDLTEVTAAAYRACVQEGTCMAPKAGAACSFSNPELEQRPVDCVTWADAHAYCAWGGKRLPSEAEWEKAARGEGGRTYPWGETTPSCTLAVMDEGSGDGCGAEATSDVASKPAGASPYGVLDMIGNAEEWVADWYDAGYYKDAPTVDPMGPTEYVITPRRVLRGASFELTAERMRAADRSYGDPESLATVGVGFRCVLAVEE